MNVFKTIKTSKPAKVNQMARAVLTTVFVSGILFIPFISTGVSAQNISSDDELNNREIYMMGLYPPNVIMRQQQRLGITDSQRKKIAGYVRDFQSEVTELQWSMPTEKQVFKEMLNERPISSDKTLEQASRVLGMESEFKLSHFKLLVAIKNELTNEQIDQLDSAIKQRMKNIRNAQ